MSAGYGLALPSLGACGIDPYTMHQGQQSSSSSLSSAAVSSSSCGSTGSSSSSLPALQPCYPPLSALVEAQQPHAGALQGPHYYFGHRHFNYSAPNLVMTNHGHHRHQSGSPTYDLEWTTPSPSHARTPAAAISTSPAAHSPPLSAAEAATPGSGGATATSPYSSSLGSWDASSCASASASADSAAVSPALFYHHHHHPPPDAAMAAAAVAVAAAGQYHHPHYHHYSHHHDHHHDDHQFQQQQQAMPAQSSFYYDLPAPTVNTDYHPQQQQQQQLQSAYEEQAAHTPSLEAMSRGRRGRKRRCDEAIMALHPSALLAVKEEEAEAESVDELYHHHNQQQQQQQQQQLQRQLDGGSSELASRRAGSHEWPFVASEESTMPADQLNSGSSEVDDDDFFSDDDDDDDETNDDGNECDSDRDGGEDSDDVDDEDDDDDDDAYAATRATKRSAQQQQQQTTMKKRRRRRKQVVKVERRVERRVEVTADLNIEAHLSPESDGYRWRKYGRKTVKGSPYPRSYFKCTFSHCPVKKQVEAVIRDGHIVSTSSIYKGKHNHDRPCVTQLTAHDQDSFRNAVLAGFADYDAAHAAHEGPAEGGGGGGARSSAGNNTPRLVVTTEASVDYLDDGYRWRKYGQKYVKGSGYPRSYYKCTDKQCPVKKQVDALLVGLVVTYEGAHTHAPCLDKSAPRKRRRRNPAAAAAAAAPAAATTRRSRAGGEAASTPVKFEPASSPEADELPLHSSSSSSSSADHSSPVAKQERRRSSHLASFRHSAQPVTYHPYHHPQQPQQYQQPPQQYHQSYHHYHHHQHEQQYQQHEYESNDRCAPGDSPSRVSPSSSSGYHGPGFFPLELKREKVEEEEEDHHHLGGQHYHHHHHQQQHYHQPQQYQTRSALGSSEELSSYISGGFEDLHGEMTDFLMWEESGRGPRHGLLLPSAPAHTCSHNNNSSSSSINININNAAAGHYHHHHHHQQQQHCQASSFPPSISSPLSAPSSSSPFSYTTPLDYDYVPTSGSSFSA